MTNDELGVVIFCCALVMCFALGMVAGQQR
jgi:hypothetical protein